MLLKLAIQNIRRSKGYFISYILTIAIFFTIIYQLSNIESNIYDYLVNDFKMSSVNLEDTFKSLKYCMYAIIIFFVIYISRFFIKRRSKEVALLKTLGLNRKNIWLMFIIENIMVVISASIIGFVLGVLSSRLFSIVALELTGFQPENVGFSIFESGIYDSLLIMGAVFIIISIIPIFTIAKSSIIELFIDQVKSNKFTKRPWISLILFIVFSITLLYQAFVIFPTLETFTNGDVLIYFANACLVAVLLYRGLFTFFFINYSKKQKGIKSPIKLLSFNHLASNIPALYKIMSFITIVSAVVTISIITAFGMLNQAQDEMVSIEYDGASVASSPYIQFASNNKDDIVEINKRLATLEDNYLTTEVVSLGEVKFDASQDTYEANLLKANLLVIKESAFKQYLEAKKKEYIPLKENEIYYSINGSCQEQVNKTYCDFIDNQDIAKTINSDYLRSMVSNGFGEFSLKPYGKNPSKNEIVITDMYNKFAVPNIVVVKDNNKVFEQNENIYFTTGLNNVKHSDVFKYFNTLLGKSGDKEINVVLTNDILITQIISAVIVGLFQIIFLMMSMITFIALIMAIFFRTLENLENSVYEYIIAKRIGLSQRQVKISVFIEAFVSQILPFLIGAIVSIFLFDKIIGNRLSTQTQKINIFSIMNDSATILILLSVLGILVFLVGILLYIINKKINEAKEVKIV